jgi:transcriptional regulator with XRE-family HTH domain
VQFRTASDLCRRCKKALPARVIFIREDTLVTGASQGPEAYAEAPSHSETDRPLPIGRTVERLRTAHGVSQEKLANLVGIRRTYLSRVENGHVMPGPGIVWQIAQVLGVSIREMLVCDLGGRSKTAARDLATVQLLRMFSELKPIEMTAVLATARQMLGENMRRSA